MAVKEAAYADSEAKFVITSSCRCGMTDEHRPTAVCHARRINK